MTKDLVPSFPMVPSHQRRLAVPPPLPSGDFELILQYSVPVAAIIPHRLPAEQLIIIYKLLPASAINQPALSTRWHKDLVLASDDWASEQLRHVPMLCPRGIKLQFVS